MKAVIDRFEGDQAVLLLGEREQQLVVSRSALPEGATEGSWMRVSFELDPEETETRRERVGELLQKLKKKGSQGKEGV